MTKIYVLFISLFAALALVACGGQEEIELTIIDLLEYDGSGDKAYFAYEGVIYDVTDSDLWEDGSHFGRYAGYDLTSQLEGAPHGTEMFDNVPQVGVMIPLELSTEDLTEYDGASHVYMFIAFEGTIYNVTNAEAWEDGEFNGLLPGNDLSDELTADDVEGLPEVGVLVD